MIEFQNLEGRKKKVTVRASTNYEYIPGSLWLNGNPIEAGSIIDYVGKTALTARFRYMTGGKAPDAMPVNMIPNKDKIDIRLTDVSKELQPLFSDKKYRPFTLESSNTNIVSVINGTMLMGKSVGTATVTMQSFGLTTNCEVTVYKGKPTSITLPKQITIYDIGEICSINAKLAPMGSGGVIEYTSSAMG